LVGRWLGPLAVAEEVDLIGQVGEALDSAHAVGLVHRDVKPGNIVVAEDTSGEHAYVCDFGLARHVSSVSSLTGERGFVGTIDYVPPEQIEGGQIDGRDVFYCWKLGEPNVQYWHEVDAGFVGRQRLHPLALTPSN